MKRRLAWLFSIMVVIALCVISGKWLLRVQHQYKLNRQLIDALGTRDGKSVLDLVNAGADPNTVSNRPLPPSLQQQDNQHLHRSSPSANETDTAFMLACGTEWKSVAGKVNMLGIAEENLPLLQTMLAHGANVNAKTDESITALHYAVAMGRYRLVELLLQHHANINAQNEEGTSPLMMAAMNEDASMVRLLLSRGANPNVQDTDGDTVLLYVIQSPHAKTLLPGLLAHGADPNLPDKKGYTPLLVAQKLELYDIVDLLKGGAGR